jgi:hypothetical protein
MTLEEFYKRYAWEPRRNRVISLNMQGDSLESLYREIYRLQNQMRPLKLYQQELIKKAEEGFKALDSAKAKTFS